MRSNVFGCHLAKQLSRLHVEYPSTVAENLAVFDVAGRIPQFVGKAGNKVQQSNNVTPIP
jgi:hypothetical protein